MMWLFAVLIVLALGAVAVVAAGNGEPLAPAYADRPDIAVLAGPGDSLAPDQLAPDHLAPDSLAPDSLARADLGGDDLRRVRFSLALRGYRMSEVDALLSRLATELDAARADPTRVESTRSATTED